MLWAGMIVGVVFPSMHVAADSCSFLGVVCPTGDTAV